MRKLVFGALLLGSLGMASGCIISSDDDDDDDSGGRFLMTWTLESGGSEVTCSDVGAGGVEALSTLSGTTQGVADVFACEPGAGTTGILPLGDYTVVVSVLDNNDDALGSSMPRSASLTQPGKDEDLGNFIFDFAPAFMDLSFSVDYGAPGGSNCSGGAGGELIDDQNTNLVLSGNSQCIAVPLLLDGTQDLGDICSELATCVESNVVQTLPDLDAGTYDLLLEGLITDTVSGDSIACFRSLDINIALTDGDEDLQVLQVDFDDTDDPTFCNSL